MIHKQKIYSKIIVVVLHGKQALYISEFYAISHKKILMFSMEI